MNACVRSCVGAGVRDCVRACVRGRMRACEHGCVAMYVLASVLSCARINAQHGETEGHNNLEFEWTLSTIA